MAMKQKCIQAVEAAIGRPLRAGEADKIVADIIAAKKTLAAQDRQAWHGLTDNEKLLAAAKHFAESKRAEFAKKKQRLALEILAQRRLNEDLAAMNMPTLDGINRLIADDYTGASGVRSANSTIKALTAMYTSRLVDLVDATKGKFLGFVSDKAMTLDIVREMHGTDTGNAIAAKVARDWREVTDIMRERFNRAGGEVGRLIDWAMPHTHSALKIGRVIKDVWVNDVLPLLNRERYVNEDGSLMTDQQVRAFLGEAYLTLKSDGANKQEPGGFTATGGISGRGSEARSIHFKDGDAWIEYQAKYGEQELSNVLMNHVRSMATNIALVERFGPQALTTIETTIQRGIKESALQDLHTQGRRNTLANRTRHLLAEVAGLNTVHNQEVADTFNAYRSLNVAGKLGGTTITAVTDGATMTKMARIHKMGAWGVIRMFGHQLRLLNPKNAADREVARELGLGIDEFMGIMSRWGDDGLATGATMAGAIAKHSGAAATATMRASFLSALTAANKASFSSMLLGRYGKLTRKKNWDQLTAWQREALQGAGIKEMDWKVWQLSKTMDRRGNQYLSHRNIYAIPDADLIALGNPQKLRERAADALLGHVLDEQGLAVLEAGAREKAMLFGSMQKGTLKGEFWRSQWQFKSFTAALMMRHGKRAMAQKSGWSKAAYLVELSALLTIFGALSVQLAELASGNDPQDMTTDDFWTAATLKGGGLGIFGDVLKAGANPRGQGMAELLGGPVLSDVSKVATITIGNTKKTFEGEKTTALHETQQLIKSHIPMQNLWYTKAATDRLFFDWMTEYANPGYFDRQAAEQRKKFDRTSWWDHEPDAGLMENLTPDRAPDWEKAVGQ